MKDTIDSQLKTIQDEVFGYLLQRRPHLDPLRPLFSSGQLDSIEAVRLVLFIEEKYDLRGKFSVRGMEDLDSVEKVALLVINSLP